MGRETLIRSTMASSLEWDANQEQSVDRVTAIAFSTKHNELGSLMLRVEAMDVQSLRKVTLIVTRELNHKHRITRGFAERMANAVLRECLHPHCVGCGGRKELHSEGEVVLTCSICGGTGLHRYTDQDRRNLVGSGYNKAVYAGALGYVMDALRMAVSGANNRLTDIE